MSSFHCHATSSNSSSVDILYGLILMLICAINCRPLISMTLYCLYNLCLHFVLHALAIIIFTVKKGIIAFDYTKIQLICMIRNSENTQLNVISILFAGTKRQIVIQFPVTCKCFELKF